MSDVIFPLIGVMVGGAVTYVVTTASERVRRQHEKADRLVDAKRQGLIFALRWLDPMESAATTAGLMATSGLRGEFDHTEFMKKWPYLLGDLEEHDIPIELRVLLPNSLYHKGHRIVRAMEELKLLGIRLGQEIQHRGVAAERFNECCSKCDEIDALIEDLRRELKAEYLATYA